MSTVRAQFRLPHDNALPEDGVTNTWYFFTTGEPTEANLDSIRDRLVAFYNDGSTSIANSWSDQYNQGAATIRYYDMADAEPRVPLRIDGALGLDAPGAFSRLPAEVALCLSFSAAVASGENAKRRRGRVYLGPFNQGTLGTDTADQGRPSSTFINTVKTAAAGLLAANDADATWRVWSELDAVSRDVTHGWVDNAWDTQRRRGVAPTARQTYP